MSQYTRLPAVILVSALIGLSSDLGTTGAGASGLPAITNPAATINPVPDFSTGDAANPCSTGFSTPDCDAYIVAAIDHARSLEGVKPVRLPSNWTSFTLSQQLFVIVNLERVDRGYPPYLGLNAALTADTRKAVAAQHYPTTTGFPVGTRNRQFQTATAVTLQRPNALITDYVFMYMSEWPLTVPAAQAPGCTNAHAAACWGARDGLLGSVTTLRGGVGLGCTTCEVGVAAKTLGIFEEFIIIVARPAHAPPKTNFKWSNERTFFNPTTYPTTTTTTALGSPTTTSTS